jgi:hypothetical protein
MNTSRRAKRSLWVVCILPVAFGSFLYSRKIAATAETSSDGDWPYYGKDAGGTNRRGRLSKDHKEKLGDALVAFTRP